MSDPRSRARMIARPEVLLVDEQPSIRLPRVDRLEESDTDPGIASPDESEATEGVSIFLGMPGNDEPVVVGDMMPEALSQLADVLGGAPIPPGRSGPSTMRLNIVTPTVVNPREEGRGHVYRREDLDDATLEMPDAIERPKYSPDPRVIPPNNRLRVGGPPAEPRRESSRPNEAARTSKSPFTSDSGRRVDSGADDYRAGKIRGGPTVSQDPSDEMPPPPVGWRGDGQIARVQRPNWSADGRIKTEEVPPVPESSREPSGAFPKLTAADAPSPVEAPEPPLIPRSLVALVLLLGLGLGAGLWYVQARMYGPTTTAAVADAPVKESVSRPSTPPPIPAPKKGVLQLWSDQTARVWVDGISKGTVQGRGADAGPRNGPSNLPPIELVPGTHKIRAVSAGGRTKNLEVRIDENRPTDYVIRFFK